MNAAQSFFACLARLCVGIVLIAHGWQKVFVHGIDGTTQNMAGMGVPLPQLAAWYSSMVELVGGILLVVGLLLPVVGLLIAVDMVGALVLVHFSHGLFLPNGVEVVLGLGAAGLTVGLTVCTFSVSLPLFR